MGAYVPDSEYQGRIANYVDEPKVSNSNSCFNLDHSLDYSRLILASLNMTPSFVPVLHQQLGMLYQAWFWLSVQGTA